MKKRLIIFLSVGSILLISVGFKNDFFEIAKQLEIFTTLFKELNMNYVDETQPADLMNTAIKNMLNRLDPYTVFMDEQDVEAYRIRNAGSYSGIGALVRFYNDKLVLAEVYKNYPADKAGLKAGDELLKIGDIMVADAKEDAITLLKGAKNTTLSLLYKRQGKEYTTSVTLEGIETDAVPFYRKIDSQTGYIVLSAFNEKAASQTQQALEELKAQGVKQLILDLRGNPGGLLDEAIKITGLFVPKKSLIVSTKSVVKKFNRSHYTQHEPVDTAIPLAILVDERSASASEIVGGALQDLDRAVIVGTQSFGKGLVQRPVKLAYGTQLKVTISRYHTPSGRCIQAIDYQNRDAEGNAMRATKRTEFKTRNGRTVYDAGGIMPDVDVASLKSSEFTKTLMEEYRIFEYATHYYYTRPPVSLDNFSLTDADFEDFKQFVAKTPLLYQAPLEKALRNAAKENGFNELSSPVKQGYETLLLNLQQEKTTALDLYKKKLMKELTDEILKRYFYREGLYTFYITHDEAVLEAVKLLSDKNRYKALLGA